MAMERLIIVRGGGDLASGTIYKLRRCGFPIIALESPRPSAIRRRVAFSEAVYDSVSKVEDMICRLAPSISRAMEIIHAGDVAMMVDEDCRILEEIRPWALVDGIMAKRNFGTKRDMSDRTIALGPGFTAGLDVDLVIETMRGHDLGRIIEHGAALGNTGVPGLVGGIGDQRVVRAECPGILSPTAQIGDLVESGQVIAIIQGANGDYQVLSQIRGILRGIIRDGYEVTAGLKIADIDPRESERNNCFTISDKSRCIAGSVLEGLLYLERRDGR